MTEAGNVYGEALYALAREEGLGEVILSQLKALDESFRREPEYLRLLGTHSLPKSERCQILDSAFRGQVQPYVLNFLKILTEKGYIRRFSDCVEAYTSLYNQDHGILSVTAVTAVALTEQQAARLKDKLKAITGKQIALTNQLDPSVLGGIRLDYDGKRMDDTVAHRLDALGSRLKNTVL